MHSYLRTGERDYRVGIWLIHPEGRGSQFAELFRMHSFANAIAAVNYLNGGKGDLNINVASRANEGDDNA